MTRPFYTCPLKVAFMAKNHGMRFVDRAGLSVSADPSMWYMAQRHYQAEALYVHPESLELLDPKQGDWILSGSFEKPIGVGVMIDQAEKTFDHGCGRNDQNLFLIQPWDDAPCYAGRDNYKILQRNGEAFFAPESEGA